MSEIVAVDSIPLAPRAAGRLLLIFPKQAPGGSDAAQGPWIRTKFSESQQARRALGCFRFLKLSQNTIVYLCGTVNVPLEGNLTRENSVHVPLRSRIRVTWTKCGREPKNCRALGVAATAFLKVCRRLDASSSNKD